ncbi:hypothetical protein HPB48_022473 [Haemaphysalis longicornis]|uniref:Uncharacterized protein n=1 Tax=Haemaphysalis longicornis TaxID=44386 RepID=A0A9J6FNP3_HAELO|nr:hypothetical protein HPB48_022473 [Haemaphysalis longicornis]
MLQQRTKGTLVDGAGVAYFCLLRGPNPRERPLGVFWRKKQKLEPPPHFLHLPRRQQRAPAGLCFVEALEAAGACSSLNSRGCACTGRFQDRTVADADRRANGACLHLPAGTELCKCGAVLLHEFSQEGRTSSRQGCRRSHSGQRRVTAKRPNECSSGPSANLPIDAEWLSQAAGESAPPRRRSSDGPPPRDESGVPKGVVGPLPEWQCQPKQARVGRKPQDQRPGLMLPPPPPRCRRHAAKTLSLRRGHRLPASPAPLATTSAADASAGTDCAPEATLLVQGSADSSPADPEPGLSSQL